MFRRVRFECEACNTGFVDWHDEEWERTPVFCVHCGEPILTATVLDEPRTRGPASPREDDSALGILKGQGDGFRDTLPGFEAAAPVSQCEGAESDDRGPESESEARPEPPHPIARAASTRPEASPTAVRESARLPRRRRGSRLSALLLGFAAGVPLTLGAERLMLTVRHSSVNTEAAEQARKLGAAANALDDGDWPLARRRLDEVARYIPASDRRLATLRARLTLSLILANRPEDAQRQLSAIDTEAPIHPARAELEHAYEAMFAPRRTELPASAGAVPSPSAVTSVAAPHATEAAAPGPPKPTFSPGVMLAAARDRQRHSRLDEAQHLYEEVLKYRPRDSEARCGLAEVQLLRGSVGDAEALFEAVLRNNADYVPAWVALGDIDWLRGRPERAACRYQLVVDRFPEGSYPPYIAQRIARVLGSGAQPPTPRADAAGPESCD